MIDLVLQAFVLSLPCLVAIDKGRMGIALLLFLITMMTICVQFILFGYGEYFWIILIVKWVFWFLGCVLVIKIQSNYQNFNLTPRN